MEPLDGRVTRRQYEREIAPRSLARVYLQKRLQLREVKTNVKNFEKGGWKQYRIISFSVGLLQASVEICKLIEVIHY